MNLRQDCRTSANTRALNRFLRARLGAGLVTETARHEPRPQGAVKRRYRDELDDPIAGTGADVRQPDTGR